MSLKEYRRKRRFACTPEPRGSEANRASSASAGDLQFVVQKHDASRLHYDLRLEMDGVLKSWAVPKGPSLDPEQKRLAVHVEDHPLEYLHFEGVIPKDEYGGGTVLVWDTGTWCPIIEENESGYAKGQLKFVLDGHKLQGRWMLVRTGARQGDAKRWLLFKERDAAARTSDEHDVLQSHPTSVLSGRTIEQIADDADIVWTDADTQRTQESQPAAEEHEVASLHRTRRGGKKRLAPGRLRGARRRAMPRTLSATLPTATRQPPSGDNWLHEIKYDGYRMLVRIDKQNVTFVSRNGNDWTDRLPHLAAEMRRLGRPALGVRQAILDGEVVVLAADGTTDFQALQNTINRGDDRQLRYYVFDLLYLNGYDIREVRLSQRKELLREVIPETSESLLYSDHILGDGAIVFQQASRLGAEGIVSKRMDCKYVGGRTPDWLKTKALRRAEFVVGGFTDSTVSRSCFGALILGRYNEKGELIHAGRVGTGFTQETLDYLAAELRRRATEMSPFADLNDEHASRDVHWVQPELVVEVEYGGWTNSGLLRFSSFRGVREDLPPQDVVGPTDESVGSGKDPKSDLAGDSVPVGDLAKIHWTHTDRVMYPETGATKWAIATYYTQIANRILPQVVKRPLSLVRCPKGCSAKCFYQKKASEGMPAAVRQVEMTDQRGKRQAAIVINDLAGLLTLVQFSVLEIHAWGCRADRGERPDRMVFDFDPDETLPFSVVRAAAMRMRELLSELGFVSFVKTTGGKGLHVVVPIRRTVTWKELASFSQALSKVLVAASPGRFTTNPSRAARRGKIYIDHLRNRFGATAITAYSTRARGSASVALPISWDELNSLPSADSFHLGNVLRRVQNIPDPWRDLDNVKQTITKRMLSALPNRLRRSSANKRPDSESP